MVQMPVPQEIPRRYTVEEYLALERSTPDRHEYRDGQIVNLGQVISMAGGAVNHSLTIANTTGALWNRLKGGPCRVHDSNLRVRIARKVLYAYPDVSVICGPVQIDDDRSAGETATNPRLIVEVLSPGTEAYDRGEKFTRYREIPSLEEYVLISIDRALVETYVRQADGTWLFSAVTGLEAVAYLRSLQIELPLAEVYAGVEFPPESQR